MILYSGCVIYVGEETALDKDILESQTGPYISSFVRSVQNSTLLPSLATDNLNNIRLNTDWPTLDKELGEAVDEGAKTVSDKLNLLTDEK